MIENNGDNISVAGNNESTMPHNSETGNHHMNENHSSAASVGQILRDERIKRNLSVGEVSRRLRLSEQKIIAIEENDFSKLPSSTFLRGFIRNYANFLQLDFNSLIPLLSKSTGLVFQQNSNKHAKTIPLESKRLGYTGGISRLFVSAIIIMSIALVGYAIFNYSNWGEYFVVKNGGDTSNALNESAKQGNGQTTMELTLPLPNLPSTSWNVVEPLKPLNDKLPMAESPSLSPPAIVEPKENVQTKVLENPIQGSEKTLQLSFSRESWVEIRDSKKKVIFSKTNAKGSEQVIKGMPPLYLVIGNASGVSLTYNGKGVDLTPYTRKVDDVARFSLE